ncbi:MAG: cob(I)yrinic acid a,c-diamide adenosyltransferase [Oscillospiraceae bacterium]
MKNGLIHAYYGNGKGKTTAAVGLVTRAIGYGYNIGFCQFLKGSLTGEEISLKKLGVTILKNSENKKFVFNMTEIEKQHYAKSQIQLFKDIINRSDEFDILVLDEMLDAIDTKLIDEEDLIHFLRNKPEKLEVILTGRKPTEKLEDICDYLINIEADKHPFTKGISSRKGIEF